MNIILANAILVLCIIILLIFEYVKSMKIDNGLEQELKTIKVSHHNTLIKLEDMSAEIYSLREKIFECKKHN